MAVLQPGFRFLPMDDELIYYLNKRIEDEPIPHNEIRDAKVYRYNPEDLVKKIFPDGEKKNYYFFSSRDRKYKNGMRPDRKAGHGYWKASCKDKEIRSAGRIVGYKKVLVYLKGNPRFGVKTNWIMHEYTVNKPQKPISNDSGMRLDDFVLCRIYERLTRKSDKKKEPSNNQPIDDQDLDEAEEHTASNTYSAPEQMPAAYHADSSLVGNDHTTSLINYQAPEQKPEAYHADSSRGHFLMGNNHTTSLVNYQAPEQMPVAYHANSSGRLFVGNNHNTTSLINYKAPEQMPAAHHANSSEHLFVGEKYTTSFTNYQAPEQTRAVAYQGGAYEQAWAGNGYGSTSAPINFYGENKDAIMNFGDVGFRTFNNDHDQKYRGAIRNERVTSAAAAIWSETAMPSESLPPNCDIFQSDHPIEHCMLPLDIIFPGDRGK